MKKLAIVIICVVVTLGLFFSLAAPVSAAAGDQTTPGTITAVSTIINIGVVATYTNDNNANNNAILEYRVSGGSWMTAPQMYNDRTDKEFRGSIFWLTANTNYEIRVTFVDADGGGVLTTTATTMKENIPIGTSYYYVAKNGNDNNTGRSADKPFLTIQKAANVVSPGDTVLVKAGTYNERVSLTRSGTADNYITFMPFGSDTVVLEGGGTLTNLFYLNGANYIRIKGFIIQNSVNQPGVYLNNSNYIIVENNTITNCNIGGDPDYGCIQIQSNSSHIIIQDNKITVDVAGQIHVADGVGWWRPGESNVIRRNTITSSPNFSLRDGIGGGPEEESAYTNNMDIYDNYITYCQDDGIQSDGGNINVRIWGNTILHTSSAISTDPVKKGPVYVFRNVGVDMQYGALKLGYHYYGHIYFYHNSFYSTQPTSDGLMQANWNPGTVTSKNNIYFVGRYIFEVTDTRPEGYAQDCDYDFMYTTDSSRFVKWEGQITYANLARFNLKANQELHGVSSSNVQFVNASGGDLHLQSSSPAIDKGVVLPGFNDANSPWPSGGSAPDIGAFEYDSTYVPGQPPSGGGGGGYIGGGGVSGGGTGGSGGGGITSLRYSLTSKGVMLEDLVATDLYMKVELHISTNTIVKNKNNQPPTSIRIEQSKENFPADSGMQLIGEMYEIGQSGITFDPAVTLVFKYAKSELPADIPAENLFIGLWDPDTTSWQDLGGILNTNARSVSTNITHLSTYALMAHTRPAEFTISGITLTPGEVSPGESVTASIIVNNQGDLSGNYTASLKVDNIIVQSKEITLSGGSNEQISFDIIQSAAGQHQIGIGDKLATLVVKQPLSPAVFNVSELSVNPQISEVDGNISVSVLVQNTGGMSGTYQATLVVDDAAIETKEVNLDPAGSTTLEFNYVSDSAGTHTASIGDQAVTFEVKDKEIPAQEQTGDNEARLEISNSSVIPSYNQSTDKLVYAEITYKMDQPWESLINYSLLLSVSHDGQLIEQIPLMTPGQSQDDGLTGELNYVPETGWAAGQYFFQIDLYHGNDVVQTAEFLPITVSAKSAKTGITWMNLGIIIGSVFLAGAIALGAVLYLKRKNIRYYWK